MNQVFRKEIPNEYTNRELLRCEVKVLRRHLRKTIIQYTAKIDGSLSRTYVGIQRESDKRLEQAFSVLRLLRSYGFNEDQRLRVPRPILYLPSLSLLLTEKAEGRSLHMFFEEKDTNLQLFMEGVARWLARLHNSGAILGRIRSSTDEIAASLKFKTALLHLFPSLSDEIESISEQMIRMQMGFQHREARPIHGDYHPKNIFVSHDSITVIDFEESCMADPAFDLGYFVAQIKMSYGSKPAILEAADRFLHTYLEELPSDGTLYQRERTFEAQTYFQRIYHTYWLLKLRPDLDLVAGWLRESRVCLEKAREQMG